jgi:hypothetical protein
MITIHFRSQSGCGRVPKSSTPPSGGCGDFFPARFQGRKNIRFDGVFLISKNVA